LIHALEWIDPEPLGAMRAGLADGQFELLGSTYAQNVAYATDDRDNARQIALHRETIQQTFGVTPTAFWNPERCWRQSLVPLIVDAGYRRTLVEDHILRDSGGAWPRVFTTHHAGRELTVLYDDETFKHKFNLAAWFGRTAKAIDHLARLNDHPDSRALCVAYAEDAEAMGLWGWSLGVIPHQTWANLDALLSRLEALDWLRLVHLSDAPPPSADLTPIADGSAAWMDNSLRRPGAPYHEDGYRNWFDFIARSPKVARFKALYSDVRSRLQEMNRDHLSQPVERLHRLGVHTLCANQYEFACIGIGGEGYAGWEGARAAFAIARAAELMEQPRRGAWLEDVDRDGREEILLCDGRQFAALSGEDARLLYWLDLVEGVQWVGNQLAVPTHSGHQPMRARWLPDSFEPDVSRFEALRVEEPAPTRMARFLPDWIWQDEPPVLNLYTRTMQLDETATPVPVRRCALDDSIAADDGPLGVIRSSKPGVEGEIATVRRLFAAGIVLVKELRLLDGALLADYIVENRGDEHRSVQLRVANELCPDYVEVLAGGRAALSFAADDERPGVVNARTGRAIVIETAPQPERIERAEGLFALEVSLVFDARLAPQSAQSFRVRLIAA
jgi:hypothetical protein